MPQFAVLHIEKAHSAVGGLGRHIDRSNIPLNADEGRQHLNRVLVDHNAHGGLKNAIDNRISEGYKGKRAIRKDAVKAMNIVLSGSHERMKSLEADGGLDDWVKTNEKWLRDEFGDKNLVSLALHRDERTPHLHAVVVPLTADGRLSAKEMMGNKTAMSDRQGRYGEAMKGFGLARGLKGSRATHDGVAEYYARVNNPVQAEISASEDRNIFGKVKGYKIKKSVLEGFVEAHRSVREDNKKLRGDLALQDRALSEVRRTAKQDKDKHTETAQRLEKAKAANTKHYSLLKAIGEGDQKTLEHVKNHFQKPEKAKKQQKQPKQGKGLSR